MPTSRTRRISPCGPAVASGCKGPELGLGEQREQVGARGEKADLDHAIGHRDDVLDRAERIFEVILAARRDLPLEQPRDLLRIHLAAVGPVGRSDAEDIAQAVVADVPALRQSADDIAARVELDEPLCDVL